MRDATLHTRPITVTSVRHGNGRGIPRNHLRCCKERDEHRRRLEQHRPADDPLAQNAPNHGRRNVTEALQPLVADALRIRGVQGVLTETSYPPVVSLVLVAQLAAAQNLVVPAERTRYRGGGNGVITFEWEGWSVAGPWGATGTLQGATLIVQDNLRSIGRWVVHGYRDSRSCLRASTVSARFSEMINRARTSAST